MKNAGMLLTALLVCSGGLRAETAVEVDGEEPNASAKIYRSVDKNGNVVNRYFSTTSPLDIVRDIDKHL